MRSYSLMAEEGVLALSTRRRSRTQPYCTVSPPPGAALIRREDGSSGLSLCEKVGMKRASDVAIFAARCFASAMRVVVTGWLIR
jgi:hypothetical protein